MSKSTQIEIMRKWKTKGKPLVSICSSTYNHAPFIRQCLDGLLMQETDFEFEILIHDDASTDKTADIIREYVKDYPAIIKPIFQTDNQYSKGIVPIITYVFPGAKAKYIAICEGDDYWTDPYKLQKQADFMDTHPEFSICFHQALDLWEDGRTELHNNFLSDSVLTIKDLTHGNFIATASTFFRNKLSEIPSLLCNITVAGDWALHFYNAQFGDIYYMKDCMSVYRKHNNGAWSRLSNDEAVVKGIEIMIDIDKGTNYKYHKEFTIGIKERINKGNAEEIMKLLAANGSLAEGFSKYLESPAKQEETNGNNSDPPGNPAVTTNDTFLHPSLSLENMDIYFVRKSILNAITEHLPEFHGTLLDLGCGEIPYKQILTSLPSRVEKYVGLDMKNQTYQQNTTPDLFWDGNVIPIEDNSVDCVVATEFFEHVPYPGEILTEVLRVLRPGGMLFFTVPFIWPLHTMPQDEYRFTPFSLERILKDSGFDDIKLKSLGGWDASLAQVIGLWTRRRPMPDKDRDKYSKDLFSFYKSLINSDKIPTDFTESMLITGLAGTAKKSFMQTSNTYISDTSNIKQVERSTCGGIFSEFKPIGVNPGVNAHYHNSDSLKSKSNVLAIVCPQVGAPSETFIRKHIEKLAPSKTVILTGAVLDKKWFQGPIKLIPIQLGQYSFDKNLSEEVIQFLKEHSVTHILCEFGCIGGAVIELNAKTLNLPVYVHFHGQDASEFLKDSNIVSYYHWMGKQVNGVIAVSKPMAERLINFGIPSDKLKVIHYGVDVSIEMHAAPEKSPCRFISASRLIPKKGILFILKAFEKAKAVLPEISLDIIGDGPLRMEIENYVFEHNLTEIVTMHGQQPHNFVLDMMDRSSVFVQHSIIDPETGNREGLPVTVLEAAAHGLPIIATCHEGIPEAVEHGNTGFLVGEGDVEKMAEYMIELAGNCSLRKKMGIAGHNKMCQDGFSTQAMIDGLRMFIGLNPESSLAYMHGYNDFSTRIIINLLKQKDLFVNVGANHGYYAQIAADAKKEIEIIAIEPMEEKFKVLNQNLVCDNLDDVLKNKQYASLFIKIDTMGHEMDVLKGLSTTFEKCDDITVLVEMNPKLFKLAGTSCKEVIEYLASKGFSVYGINDRESKYYPLDVEDNLYKLETRNFFFNALCVKKEKSLSVAFFSHSSILTGAERSLADLVEDLCNNSVLCSVLLPSDGPLKDVLLNKGAAVYVLPQCAIWWVDKNNSFSKEEQKTRLAQALMATFNGAMPVLRQLKPDVIFTQTIVAPWGALCAEIMSIPHALSVCEYGELDHNFKFYFGFQRSIKALYDSSKAIYSITKSVKNEVFKGISDKENKIEVVYRSVRLAPNSNLDIMPHNYAYKNKSEIKIGVFGTIQKGKGQEDIVRAGIELMKRGLKIKVYIIGYSDPQYLAFIKDLISGSAYKIYFIINDFVDDPLKQMKEMDIIVSCSRNEALGRTLFEAILLNKPIVYADSGGPKEIFTDKKHGLAYKCADEQSLVEKLLFVMDHPDKTIQRVKTAKEYVLKNFNAENFSGKIEASLKQIKVAKIKQSRIMQTLLSVDFLMDALQGEIEQKDAQIAITHYELAKCDGQISALNHAAAERDAQITTLNQAIVARQAQISALNQTAVEREAQLTLLNQAVSKQDVHITILNQTIVDRNKEIGDLKAQTELHAIRVAEQGAIISKFTSSRSWRITRPLRFAGRILRGTWKAVKDYLARYRNNCSVKPAAGCTRGMETATLLEDSVQSAVQSVSCLEQPGAARKRILLVSYYCPTRAHAGGLRILDIYSQIKSEFPAVGLDLYTYRRPEMDWSYDDVEVIFDAIYYSDTEELSFKGLLKQCKVCPRYDVIDLQFHRSAVHIDEFRALGAKILFTPIESLASSFFIAVKEALCHAHGLSLKDIWVGVKHSAEELKFCLKADEVICVSIPDATFLRTVSRSRKIGYLESGISDIEFKHALSECSLEITPRKKENIIIYVAFFGSETNILAMKWYLDKVHPLIKKQVPDYMLHVVGRGDLSVFAGYQDKAIIFVGAVPSLGPYISEAKVGIAPALGGSGLRGKVSQYAIYGVPSVVSPIAAKGLAYEDGVDIYITEIPEIFAERCVMLLKNEETNKRIGDRARQTALRNYTWKSKMDIIRKAYALDECGSINKPKVTALVPSYNHSRYLRQRIESVMRQTYSNVELIVIDDCSDDDSDEVIKSLQVQYGFIYVRNTCNSRSPFASWERGIRLGTGDYIWICESDDYAEPGFLEVTVDALMRNKGAVMAYCDSWIVNEQDQKIDHTDTYFHEIWREFRWDQGFVSAGADELRNFQLRGQTVPNMSSALFTMNAFKKAYNPFLKKFRLTGDWLFVGWVLRHGSAVFCKQTLSNFRKHELTARVRVKSARSQAEYIVTKYLLFQLSGRNWCEFSAIMSTDAIRFLYEPAGPFDVLRALLRISFLKTVQCGGLFAASLAMNSHLVRKFWQRYKLVKGGI